MRHVWPRSILCTVIAPHSARTNNGHTVVRCKWGFKNGNPRFEYSRKFLYVFLCCIVRPCGGNTDRARSSFPRARPPPRPGRTAVLHDSATRMHAIGRQLPLRNNPVSRHPTTAITYWTSLTNSLYAVVTRSVLSKSSFLFTHSRYFPTHFHAPPKVYITTL